MFADFVPGTGRVGLSVAVSTSLDAATLLNALDRYPFGCSEQITSRAVAMLYVNELAAQARLSLPTARSTSASRTPFAPAGAARLQRLVRPVVGRRRRCVARFLRHRFPHARAERGFEVPATAFTLALDRLRNYVGERAGAGQGRRPRTRLCALCAGAQRRGAGRRPALHRRREACRCGDADRQGADRRGARHARRQGAFGSRLSGRARFHRAAAQARSRPRRFRLGAARFRGAGDAGLGRARAAEDDRRCGRAHRCRAHAVGRNLDAGRRLAGARRPRARQADQRDLAQRRGRGAPGCALSQPARRRTCPTFGGDQSAARAMCRRWCR